MLSSAPSYQLFIRYPNNVDTGLYLVKYVKGKEELIIEIGDEAEEYWSCMVLPDDCVQLGTVKEVDGSVLILDTINGSEDCIPIDEHLAWVINGLLSGEAIVGIRKDHRIMFSKKLDRNKYIGNKEYDEAEWRAVKKMFPKATKTPWLDNYDNVFDLETAIATRKKSKF